MNILIVGATGVLGARLYKDMSSKEHWDVLGTYCSSGPSYLKRLDLRNKKEMEDIVGSFKPDIVLVAGGITNVDLCEADPGLAEEVNVQGTTDLMNIARSINSKIIFLSTDYIFNGEKGPYSEDDGPSPINIYGMTKLKGESALKLITDDYIIVRTAQLFGLSREKRNFTEKIIFNIRNKKMVCAASDFYCTPTYAGGLSLGIIGLVEKSKKGTYNIAGTDFVNRVEFVNNISDIFKLDKKYIQEVRLKDLELKALRPKKAGLKIDKIKKELNIPLYSSREGLELFKKEMSE
ncbi:MAG: SDR family oxidoreductase [Candidatus Omnitrophota bacterium]